MYVYCSIIPSYITQAGCCVVKYPPTHDIIALRASFDALGILVMTLVTLVLYANKLVLLILFYRLGVIS